MDGWTDGSMDRCMPAWLAVCLSVCVCMSKPVPKGCSFFAVFAFLCVFSVTSSKQGGCLTCNSGSPTRRLLQVTEMDSGRRIHVPVLKCRITIFHFFEELGHFLLSWQGGQAKNHPRRSRQHTAFPGIFPLLRRVLKPTTTCGLSSVCVCVCAYVMYMLCYVMLCRAV